MSTPILSICIPTYNRSLYLQDCLESIKIQLDSDETLSYVVEVVPLFKNFTYRKNTTNIGFDLNVAAVVKAANGHYCWYLGDDDTIVNGGIKHILSIIKNNEYDVVTVDAEPITENRDYHVPQIFLQKSIIEVLDHNEFYFRGFCQGAFSVFIFKRELWLANVDEKKGLVFWLYFETILKMLIATTKKMVSVRDFVIITGQDCRWSENGSEIYTFINSNLLLERMIEFGFDKERISRELHINKKQIIIMLLRAKGHGLKINKKNWDFIRKNMRTDYVRMAIVTVLFFVPNKIIVTVRNIKKRILNQPIR
jgi:glycosyltransferase involved in cell wall biosynthesis